MKYKVKVRPQHERIALIEQLRSASDKEAEYWEIYEGKPTSLRHIQLEIDVPIYRMANGRTQMDQLVHVAEAKLPPDFFSAGEENVSAQEIQHMLLNRVSDEGPDSIASIYTELERAGQTQPLLITPTGVVVNGNRRLAAMRELFGSGKYPRFATVLCAVLPYLTSDQIDDVEDRLQMVPETKLPYTWINDAMRVRKRLAAKGKDEAVAHVMRRDKTQIRKAISALSFVDTYLKEWKKAPYDYNLVADGKQFFFDLPDLMKGKEGELLEASLRMAWILFDNRKKLGGSMYEFSKVLGDKAGEALDKLTTRVDSGVAEGDPDDAPVAELEIDFGEDTTTADAPLGQLISAMDDVGRREELFEELRPICADIIAGKKADKLGSSALNAVRAANTKLTEVDLGQADPKTYDGIEKQLDELISRAHNLQNRLAEAKAKSKGKGQVVTH